MGATAQAKSIELDKKRCAVIINTTQPLSKEQIRELNKQYIVQTVERMDKLSKIIDYAEQGLDVVIIGNVPVELFGYIKEYYDKHGLLNKFEDGGDIKIMYRKDGRWRIV